MPPALAAGPRTTTGRLKKPAQVGRLVDMNHVTRHRHLSVPIGAVAAGSGADPSCRDCHGTGFVGVLRYGGNTNLLRCACASPDAIADRTASRLANRAEDLRLWAVIRAARA